MTNQEKAIVMAYTGKAMLVGDKLDIFYKYIEKICGRPIWTHELADKAVWDEIEEKSKPDFIELCKETTVSDIETAPTIEPERKKGKWIKHEDDERISGTCSCCGWDALLYETDVVGMPFCPNCGAEMEEER